MNTSGEPPRRYKWPWIAALMVLIGIVMAVIWVRIAVKKVESERGVDTPLPNTAPMR